MLTQKQRTRDQDKSKLTSTMGVQKNKVLVKLHTALHYVINTCIFGSSNKYSDIKKTNTWVLFFPMRYEFDTNYYVKQENKANFSWDKTLFNLKLDPVKCKFEIDTKNKWNFHVDLEKFNQSSQYGWVQRTELAPLLNKNLNADHLELLYSAMLCALKRQGNCENKACLLAKYLWENHDNLIDRIEIVDIKHYDHEIIIINRSRREHSTLEDSNTWGDDCWVIDTWYKQGLIFPANQFHFYMPQIEEYAFAQARKYALLMESQIKNQLKHRDEDSWLKHFARFEINPLVDYYPTCQTNPLLPVEYYYSINTECTSGLDKSIMFTFYHEHKSKLASCLQQLSFYTPRYINQSREVDEPRLTNNCVLL